MNNEDIQDCIVEIITYLKAIHEKHADGCTGSCHEKEVGYHHSTYYGSKWFIRFGGYCLGDLSRWEEVQADTLKELLPKLKEHIETSIKRQEEWALK